MLSLRGEVYARLEDWAAAAEDFSGSLEVCERKEYLVAAELSRRLLEDARRRAFDQRE